MKSRKKAAKKGKKKTARRAPRKAAKKGARKKTARRKRASTRKGAGRKKGAKKSNLPRHSEPHTIHIKKSRATPKKAHVSSKKPCSVRWKSGDFAYALTFSIWPFVGPAHRVLVPASDYSETLRVNGTPGSCGYAISPPPTVGGPKPDPEIVVDE